MKELCGIQAQLSGRCNPKDLVPAGGRCASPRRFSFPRHLQSSAATGNSTCCGEMAQKNGMSFVTGKGNPCWRLGLQSTLWCPWSQAAAPAWTGLAAQEPSGDRQDRDTGTLLPLVTSHTSTASPHSSIPMAAPMAGWPQPGWHNSQSALHLFKDFHLRISCQAKVTDNRVMTRICWNTLRLCFSTLGC